jgi:hypothetical protein
MTSSWSPPYQGGVENAIQAGAGGYASSLGICFLFSYIRSVVMSRVVRRSYAF